MPKGSQSEQRSTDVISGAMKVLRIPTGGHPHHRQNVRLPSPATQLGWVTADAYSGLLLRGGSIAKSVRDWSERLGFVLTLRSRVNRPPQCTAASLCDIYPASVVGINHQGPIL